MILYTCKIEIFKECAAHLSPPDISAFYVHLQYVKSCAWLHTLLQNKKSYIFSACNTKDVVVHLINDHDCKKYAMSTCPNSDSSHTSDAILISHSVCMHECVCKIQINNYHPFLSKIRISILEIVNLNPKLFSNASL